MAFTWASKMEMERYSRMFFFYSSTLAMTVFAISVTMSSF